MSDIELPDLPKSAGWAPAMNCDIYTADQLRAYVLADREKRAQAARGWKARNQHLESVLQAVGDLAASSRTGPAKAESLQGIEEIVIEALEHRGDRFLPFVPKVVHDTANEVCQAVAELPDRNSPEDWPEAMLVTHDELRLIVEQALLFEHEDGRYAVNPDTTGDPGWHRMGPVEVFRPSTNATVTQWQKRHSNIDGGEWKNTNEADAKWWRENSKGWEIRALYATPTEASKPVQAEAPAASNAERAAFEAAAREEWDGKSIPDAAWIGWQLRAALATQPTASNAGERLTDEQIYEIADSDEASPDDRGWGPKFSTLKFARLIERAALAQVPEQVAQDKIDAERWRAARGEFCNTVWCAIGAGESGKGLDDFLDEAIAARAVRTSGEGSK